MLNQQIGQYKITKLLGEGGMALVYLAEKGSLGKLVALKVLKEDFISNRNVRGRFLSEARKMINLNHPNIVGVQDLIDDGDFVAIELEYIDGKTLKQHLHEKGALPDDEIQYLFKQMLDAISFVHEKGYVHRDIKPSNFMLSKNGIIKLTDFGIAKNGDDTNIDYTGTGTGMQMGTPKYMSPEQVRNTKDVDYRSDIYSLGVVLWEMVTGKVPYDIKTESTFDVFRKIVDEPLAKTGTKWDEVIDKATRKEIGERKLELSFKRSRPIKPPKNPAEVIKKRNKKTIYILAAIGIGLLIIFVGIWGGNNSKVDVLTSVELERSTKQEIPEWKQHFEEQWELAEENELQKGAKANKEAYEAIYDNLPLTASDEREKVRQKISKYKIKQKEDIDNSIPSEIERYDFKEYCNSRFEFCLSYPSQELIPQGESGNSDGQLFLSMDKKKSLTVYRDFRDNISSDGFKINKIFREDLLSFQSKGEVTYHTIATSSFVITGYYLDSIFYQKTIISEKGLATAILYYPKSDATYYNLVCQTVNTSFK